MCIRDRLRTGHAENLEPFTEEYLDDLMNCAEGIIDGSIEPTVYPRRDASYASYGRANIVYYPYQIFDADFTDLNEAIQDAEDVYKRQGCHRLQGCSICGAPGGRIALESAAGSHRAVG